MTSNIVWNNVPIVPKAQITWVHLSKLECLGLPDDFTGCLARECGAKQLSSWSYGVCSWTQLYEKAIIITHNTPQSEEVVVYAGGGVIATLKGQC